MRHDIQVSVLRCGISLQVILPVGIPKDPGPEDIAQSAATSLQIDGSLLVEVISLYVTAQTVDVKIVFPIHLVIGILQGSGSCIKQSIGKS